MPLLSRTPNMHPSMCAVHGSIILICRIAGSFQPRAYRGHSKQTTAFGISRKRFFTNVHHTRTIFKLIFLLSMMLSAVVGDWTLSTCHLHHDVHGSDAHATIRCPLSASTWASFITFRALLIRLRSMSRLHSR